MQLAFTYGDIRILILIGYLIFNQSAHLSPGNNRITGILGCTCIYFLIRFVLTLKNNLYASICWLLLIWGISEAIYGNLQLYGHYPSNNGLYRFTGSFLNPGPFSGFLSCIFPLALACISQPAAPPKKNIGILRNTAWLCLFLTLSLLPAGMSRAAWLAVITGSLVVLCHHYSPLKFFRQYYIRHKRKILYGLSGLLIFLFTAGISTYYLKKDSADGRLLIWKITARIIAEHPATGVGAGNFAGAYGKKQAAYFAEGKATPQEKLVAGSPEYGFNEFLQIAAEYGIPGLILFCIVLIFAFRKAWKNGQAGITGSLTAFLTFACFSYPFSVPQLNILFPLLLGIANSDLRSSPAAFPKRQLLFTGIVLLCFLFPLFQTGKQWKTRQKAINTWKEEQTYYNMQIYEGTTDNYRKLYPALKDEPAYLFEWGQCLSKTGLYEESNQILREGAQISSDPMFWNIMGKNYQALKQYQEAEKCFLHACNMIPHRLYPLYLLANLYFDSGETSKGIATARMVITRQPKITSSAIEEMKAEMKEKLNTFEP